MLPLLRKLLEGPLTLEEFMREVSKLGERDREVVWWYVRVVDGRVMLRGSGLWRIS
ncbi:hypothetical protein [Pyrobaculum aerophilum]|uniref:hypothetical protein n=1 Tax=Pyrobaculum aerophilum TaxID=13773 RepID=UPI0015F29ADA|nr:hypothetical protein [Pyrobaculum aerophilum]MCX8135775.1 hypothetical protein [Pyrobaculum aerophilum]